jgi:hypothetical protein
VALPVVATNPLREKTRLNMTNVRAEDLKSALVKG